MFEDELECSDVVLLDDSWPNRTVSGECLLASDDWAA
jgi:hypothetical protein